MKKTWNPFLLALSLILVTACGKSGVSSVKIVSGQDTSHFNLLTKITSFAATNFTASSCSQTQIFAAHGPHSDSGGGTQDLTVDSVNFSTPTFTTANQADVNGSDGNGLLSWLAASQLTTVVFNVATGATIDFGIGGSLTPATASAVTANGDCPLIDPSTQAPYPSFSLLGHDTATITGDTTIPIYLFATDAQPVATTVPIDPGGICDQDSNDENSQQCPNLNFKQILVGPCLATNPNCTSQGYGPTAYLQILALPDSGGSFHVTQWVSLAQAQSGIGVYVADVAPFQFTIYNGATPVATAIYNDNGNNSSTTTTNANGSTTVTTNVFSDQTPFTVNDGAAGSNNNNNPPFVIVSPAPGGTFSPGLLPMNWTAEIGAVNYVIQAQNITTAGAAMTCATIPASNLSYSVALSICNVMTAGDIYAFKILAQDANNNVIGATNPIDLTFE
jgi:hypothetical protein